MMTIRPSSLRRASLALAAASVMAACGGGSQAFTPSPIPTPVPTPVPTPEPNPEPTPAATSCSPLPPSISRLKVKIHLKSREYWTLDVTPLVGPDAGYCARIGFTDGRAFCPVRPEGDPDRQECEAWAIGQAEDTGRPGPTWYNPDMEPCTGLDSRCINHPDSQYHLWIYTGGMFTACAANEVCGQVFADKDL